METINDLLKALDNKVPASIAKRLDGLKKLNEKLVSARKEHDENPTDESQEALDEILEFLNDTQEDIREDLLGLVEAKRDTKLKEKEESDKKQLAEEALKLAEKTETEKKSGIGWGSLLLGGALLVMTGGAIKYFGSKR